MCVFKYAHIKVKERRKKEKGKNRKMEMLFKSIGGNAEVDEWAEEEIMS
jgi:hypothetical protein